jgi:hypothetical protein
MWLDDIVLKTEEVAECLCHKGISPAELKRRLLQELKLFASTELMVVSHEVMACETRFHAQPSDIDVTADDLTFSWRKRM